MSVFAGEFEVWAGEDLEFRFTIKDADGVAEDITGWTVALIVHNEATGVLETLTATWAITDAANGKGKITVAAADSAGLSEGVHNCRARRTNSGGKSSFSDWRIRVRTD